MYNIIILSNLFIKYSQLFFFVYGKKYQTHRFQNLFILFNGSFRNLLLFRETIINASNYDEVKILKKY